jgi:rhamnosyltransferase
MKEMINKHSRFGITAVLVSFNPDLTFFIDVIKRILKQVDHLILIDNGSTSQREIKDLVRTFGDTIEALYLEENIGLASAQNIAIKQVLNETQYVVLFDQDSLIEENLITNLTAAHDNISSSGKKVGAVGPTFFDPVTGSFYPATLYCGPFIKRMSFEDKPVKATFIIASGCLISTQTLRIVGLMKDDFFIDYIDVEWSLRAKRFGFDVYMIPSAKMQHSIGDARISVIGRTMSVHSPLRRYYLIRNSLLIIRLSHIPLGYKLRELIFNFLRAIIAVSSNKEKLLTLRYIFRGFYDGIRGKVGRFVS